MKGLLKNTIYYAVALYLLQLVFSGVIIHGGVAVYLTSGFILSILMFVCSPLFKLVTLPLNIATFGIFTFVINALILYILTVIVPQISIQAFKWNGATFMGFVVPTLYFNVFFAYIVSALFISLVVSFIKWLTK